MNGCRTVDNDAIYIENSRIYARTKDVSKLSEDSQGRIIFKGKIERKGYHFVCRACGRIRYIRPSDIERGRGKYCSSECYFGTHPRRWQFCPICGTLFSIKQSKAEKWENHFCSRECYNKAKSELMVHVNLNPSPELAYILGVIVGDGCVGEYIKKWGGEEKKHYEIKLGVVDYKFAKRFASALRKIGLHPNLWKDKKVKKGRENEQKLWHVVAYSKTFVRFFLSLKSDWDEFEKFVRSCPKGKEMFLRGFYESEGHHGVYTYHRGSGIQHVRKLHITNTNPDLIKITITFLRELGFHPYTIIEKREHLGWKDKTTIRLPPREHRRFLALISPVVKK